MFEWEKPAGAVICSGSNRYLMQKPTPVWALALWLALVTLWPACRLNPVEDLSWDTDLLVPIAFTELGVMDAVPDSLLTVEDDQLLALVYRDTLASASLAEFVEFPDTSLDLSIKLDTLSLDSDTISQRLTLADLARQLSANGDATGDLILANHGNTLPFVPETPGLNSGIIPVDASEFFEYAELDSGELVLTIDNQFPLNLLNVIFRIENANLPGPPIVLDTFQVIGQFSSVTRTYDLAGTQIGSELEAELVNLDIGAGLFVPIDTTDYIELSLIAQNLQAQTATAIFPAQTILDTVRETRYLFGGEFADVQLTKLKVKAGRIRAETISTVEDSVRFRYSLPSAVNSLGEVPTVDIKLDPAPPGGMATQLEEATLEGFTIDLSQGGLSFNTLEEQIRVDLLYSGQLVTLDQTDSVLVSFGLVDIEPVYVEGYIGQNTFTFTGSEALGFFEELEYERLRLSAARAAVSFSSSIGVDAAVEVRAFDAVGQRGERVRLTGTPLVAGPFLVQGPVLPDTFGSVVSPLELNPDNSNILPFINVLPAAIDYDLRVETNVNGQAGQYTNFATDQSQITAFLDFRLPLEGIVEGFSLTDTVAVDFGEAARPEAVSRARLRLLLENPFPVQVTVEAGLYDQAGTLLQSLDNGTVIPAGIPNASGYVDVPAQEVIELDLSGEQLDRVLAEAVSARFRFVLDTRPKGEPAGFYADYKIKARLSGQFTYTLEP
ncbi:MAG: hypothetical protein D6722_15405 [Bacteroidetes bacterium]|nr:MAG: hypothetical protein D6722_15405 [Bacteroidota bacterium]